MRQYQVIVMLLVLGSGGGRPSESAEVSTTMTTVKTNIASTTTDPVSSTTTTLPGPAEIDLSEVDQLKLTNIVLEAELLKRRIVECQTPNQRRLQELQGQFDQIAARVTKEKKTVPASYIFDLDTKKLKKRTGSQ